MADHAPQLATDGIHDAARVLRLPGSINSKSGRLVTYGFNPVSSVEPLVSEMEDMAKRLGLCPSVSVSIPSPTQKVVKPSTEPPYSYANSALIRKRQKAGKAGRLALGER